MSERSDYADGPHSAFEAWTTRGKTAVYVTSDGLTVDQRPGEIFQFSDAKLGPWIHGGLAQGTALHLQCGSDPFVLGGLYHRVATRTRLEAPPVEFTDGGMRAAEFDELLTMVARKCGWDVRRPAPGELTRCLLFPNTSKAWQISYWPWVDFIRRRQRKKLPSLAIDVGDDAIWVIEADTNAVIASASIAQVTATPTTYTGYSSRISEAIADIQWVIDHWERPPRGGEPVLDVAVPGFQSLTMACPRHVLSTDSWFEWRGEAPRANVPDYLVSGADWLTLVEKFGLAQELDESYNL